MIVKGTRQLGSFKRGINLYIPKNIAIPELTIPLNGLKLWLKADAGITEESISFVSQIVLTNATEAGSNGTYTRASGGTTQFIDEISGNYIEWDGTQWLLYDNTYSDYTYRNTSFDLSAGSWTTYNAFGPPTAVNTSSTQVFVAVWADQSQEGNDALPDVEAPTLSQNQINGKPAVVFSSGQWLQVPENSIGNAGNLNIFIVLNYTSGGILLNKGDGASFGGTVWEMAPQNGFGYVDNSGPSWAVVSYVPSEGTKIIEMACDAGSIEVFENSVSQGSAGPIGSVNSISQYIGIGGGGTSGGTQSSLEAKIAEIIIYDAFLTSSQRASIYSYLNGRYAIY